MHADSAFASVKSAAALRKENGLAFAGIVKTAHREFPKKFLSEIEVKERGDHVSVVTEKDGVKMMGVAWADRQRKMLVSTYGNTLPGQPHVKKRWEILEDGSERQFTKEVKRPSIFENFFDAAPAIDVHNHLRQGNLALEQALKTDEWHIRVATTLIGMTVVDAWLAYRYFSPVQNHGSLTSFQETLTVQLLSKPVGSITKTRGQKSAQHADLVKARKNLREQGLHKPTPLRKSLYGEHARQKYKQSLEKKVKNAVSRATKNAQMKENEKLLRDYRFKLRCALCTAKANTYCPECSDDSPISCKRILALCGPNSSQKCFWKHSHLAQE